MLKQQEAIIMTSTVIDKDCNSITHVDSSNDGTDDTWESCKECEGEGSIFTMYHENYDEVEEECDCCEGTGKHIFGVDIDYYNY